MIVADPPPRRKAEARGTGLEPKRSRDGPLSPLDLLSIARSSLGRTRTVVVYITCPIDIRPLNVSSKKIPLKFRIVGHRLPGLKFGMSAGAMIDREPVYLGIQRNSEVIDLVRGDAPRAVFEFAVDVVSGSDDGLDFRGPFVHGDKGKRFLYLSWGEVGADGGFSMFRRAKLPLSAIESKDLIGSLSSPLSAAEPVVVEGTLDLTDEGGGPICAAVLPPKINWRVLVARARKQPERRP
jgi:hypothetical protein